MEIIFQVIFWLALAGVAIALAMFFFPALVAGAVFYMITGDVIVGVVVALMAAAVQVMVLAREY